MQITVSAGKGGTGKTTVAVNLALALKETHTVEFLDCDVEEPDAGIFLKPEIKEYEPVSIKIPKVSEDICTYCGNCSEACEFNAIATFSEGVLVYPELCHGCGLCSMVCPEDAIYERNKDIGEIRSGTAGPIDYSEGDLRVGQPMATPIIRAMKKKKLTSGKISILDSPPGTACPVIESLYGSDFALLVTEPTPFGLHDLKLSVKVARKMNIPIGVVINRDGIGNEDVENYCRSEGVPVLMKIPNDRKIAELYSSGIPLLEEYNDWKGRFNRLFEEITRIVGQQASIET